MKKAWRYVHDPNEGHIARTNGDELIVAWCTENAEFDDGELMAAAPDICRALLAVEWSERPTMGKNRLRCPSCGCSLRSLGGDGHDPSCLIDAALTKAGLPDQASRDAARKELGL